MTRPINDLQKNIIGSLAPATLETQLATPKGGRAEAFSLRVWSSLAVVRTADKFVPTVDGPQVPRTFPAREAIRVGTDGISTGVFQFHEMVATQFGTHLPHMHLRLAQGTEQVDTRHDRIGVVPAALFGASVGTILEVDGHSDRTNGNFKRSASVGSDESLHCVSFFEKG